MSPRSPGGVHRGRKRGLAPMDAQQPEIIPEEEGGKGDPQTCPPRPSSAPKAPNENFLVPVQQALAGAMKIQIPSLVKKALKEE